jgi:hypothetical protein
MATLSSYISVNDRPIECIVAEWIKDDEGHLILLDLPFMTFKKTGLPSATLTKVYEYLFSRY